MIDAIRTSVATERDIDASQVQFTLHSGSRGELGFVTFLLSTGDETLDVCRVARGEEERLLDVRDRLDLANEAAAGDPWLERTLERRRSLERLDGRLALFCDPLPGKPADRLVSGYETANHVLRVATDWLVAFVRSTREYHVLDREEKRNVVDTLLCEVESAHVDQFVLDDRLFAGPVHGDFIPGNLLFDDGELSGVVDFENFLLEAVPQFDLYRLVIGTAMLVEDEVETLLRRTFFEETPLSRTVWRCIQRYADGTNVPPEAHLDVLPLYADLMLGQIMNEVNPVGPPSTLVSIHYRLGQRLRQETAFDWAR